MIGGVGQGGGLARAAIEAALASQGQAARRLEGRVEQAFQLAAGADARQAELRPADAAREALSSINEVFDQVEQLPLDLAGGGIQDFSELAARLKQSELTFKFALEVRNKLIDAYRETMRMSV